MPDNHSSNTTPITTGQDTEKKLLFNHLLAAVYAASIKKEKRGSFKQEIEAFLKPENEGLLLSVFDQLSQAQKDAYQCPDLNAFREIATEITEHLTERVDEGAEGFLKLSYLPKEGAKNDFLWEIRFQLPGAYNVATSQDFLDRYRSLEDTTLRLIQESTHQYKKEEAFKRLAISTRNIHHLLQENAFINPKIMKKAHRGDAASKAHFKKQGKIGLALLQEYSNTLADILSDLEGDTSALAQKERLKSEEIKDSNKNRPMLTNFYTIEKSGDQAQVAIAETHLPKDPTTYSSASHHDAGLHNYLNSIQQTFLKETVDRYEVFRSSTLSGIGLIDKYPKRLGELSLKAPANPFFPANHDTINPDKNKERNQTEDGVRLNHLLFKKLYRENIKKIISERKEKGAETPYILHTILSPINSPLLDRYLASNPDRIMVENTAKAIFRYENELDFLYFNEGTNISRGNGGKFEATINARGLGKLNQHCYDALGVSIPALEEKLSPFLAQLNTLKDKKNLLYKQLDDLETKYAAFDPETTNINETTEYDILTYHAIEKDAEEIEDKINLLYARHNVDFYNAFKEISPKNITGDNAFILQNIIKINEHYQNNHHYLEFTFSKSPLNYLAAIALSPLLGVLYAGGALLNALGANGSLLTAPTHYALRFLGFTKNTKNYDGPAIISSIAQKLNIPFHFTCKSGEDRTGALDNKRKALHVCELQAGKPFDIDIPKNRKQFTKTFEHTCEFSTGNQTNKQNMPGGRLQLSSADIDGDLDHNIPKFMAVLASRAYGKTSKKGAQQVRSFLKKEGFTRMDEKIIDEKIENEQELSIRLAACKASLHKENDRSLIHTIDATRDVIDQITRLRMQHQAYEQEEHSMRSLLSEIAKKITNNPKVTSAQKELLTLLQGKKSNAHVLVPLLSYREIQGSQLFKEMIHYPKIKEKENAKHPFTETHAKTHDDLSFKIKQNNVDKTTSFEFDLPENKEKKEKYIEKMGIIAQATQKNNQTNYATISVQSLDEKEVFQIAKELYQQCLKNDLPAKNIHFDKSMHLSDAQIAQIKGTASKATISFSRKTDTPHQTQNAQPQTNPKHSPKPKNN